MSILPTPKSKKIGKSHQRSKVQEKERVKQIKRSGAGPEKGDLRMRGVFRSELKTTIHASYSLKLTDLEKIEEIAALAGELPVFEVEFNTPGLVKPKSYAIIPVDVLDELLNVLTKTD